MTRLRAALLVGAASLAGAAGLAFAAKPAPTTKGLVVTYFWYAHYEGEDDCPAGPAVGSRRLQMPRLLATVPPDVRERLLKPGNEQELNSALSALALENTSAFGYDLAKYVLGPNLAGGERKSPGRSGGRDPGFRVNVQCERPAEFEDPEIATVQGKVAFGLDLDRHAGSGAAAPNTCSHQNFTGPAGEPGIDNQMYRVLGCIDGYRKSAAKLSPTGFSAGTKEDWFHGGRKDGATTILIEITGVDDAKNDRDVEVAIYPSKRATPYDSLGKTGVPNYSLVAGAPEAGEGYTTRAHGRITDGVLTTDPADLQIPFAVQTGPAPYRFRGARLRLEMQPDGSAKGLLAGYLDVESAYYTEVGSHTSDTAAAFTLFDGGCPGIYAAMHKLADGTPDPVTGRCTSISSAFKVEAVPAFVIHKTETAGWQR